LHGKTISIDSEICSIGSANIDIRSFSISYEINTALCSERHAKELESAFERDLVHCAELEEWKSKRAAGSIARQGDGGDV
jgi:cardiolipin synthase